MITSFVTKIMLVLALVAGAGIAVSSTAPAVAYAQPGGNDPHAGHDHGDGVAGPAGNNAPAAARAPRVQPPSEPGKSTTARDVTKSSGAGMAILFWIFALGCVGGSLFVITRRNLIAAVMGMVATFFAVSAVYMMLFASFLAVIQMLVYAGAIMVLFVFVVMVLNKPEDEPWVGGRARIGKIFALVAMAYLLLRMVSVLWAVRPPDPVTAELAPRAVQVETFVKDDRGRPVPRVERYDWGSTAAVGHELFTDGLFPFEAISILLLIAVVGAIAIARQPLRDDEAAPAAEGHR